MKQRVEFVLTMPNVGSWDGKWSGAGKHYAIVRRIHDDEIGRLALPRSWLHSWEDGWAACVSVRVMEKGERVKRSAGFCGYDWMVDNILRWGTTRCQCEWVADDPGWERCRFCRTQRKVPA